MCVHSLFVTEIIYIGDTFTNVPLVDAGNCLASADKGRVRILISGIAAWSELRKIEL